MENQVRLQEQVHGTPRQGLRQRSVAPGLPEISFGRAKRLSTRLLRIFAASDFIDKVIEGATFRDLVQTVARALQVPETVIEPTLSHQLTKQLTLQSASKLAAYLSVNSVQLKQMIPVMPGGSGSTPGWAVVRIDDIVPNQNKDKHGLELQLRCRVVWGPWYGVTVVKSTKWPSVHMNGLMRRTGLLTRRRRSAFPRELVQLYLFVELAMTGDQTLTFGKSFSAPYLLCQNKKLISARKKPCPLGKRHPCYMCLIGYDACYRAVRPVQCTVEGSSTHDSNQSPTGGTADSNVNRQDVLDVPAT